MQVLSVEDVAGLKYYRLQDEKGQAFIAEPLFYAKKPKSRLTAEIVREIEGLLERGKTCLNTLPISDMKG